jgi:tetratricopeptide (TPR) repeat protein
MAAVKVKIPGAVIGSRELSILLLTLFLASAAGGEDLSARDWSEMGNAQVKRGEYQEAIASYDRAIALEGYNPNIWYNKGLALSSLGRYEEALYCYHRGSNLQPFDPTSGSPEVQPSQASAGMKRPLRATVGPRSSPPVTLTPGRTGGRSWPGLEDLRRPWPRPRRPWRSIPRTPTPGTAWGRSSPTSAATKRLWYVTSGRSR